MHNRPAPYRLLGSETQKLFFGFRSPYVADNPVDSACESTGKLSRCTDTNTKPSLSTQLPPRYQRVFHDAVSENTHTPQPQDHLSLSPTPLIVLIGI